MRKIIWGLIVAATLALMVLVPAIGTVSTWKIVLAAIGLLVFAAAGAPRSKAGG